MSKNNKMVKIMAFLALFGIIIGVIGTGILIMFSGGNTNTTNQDLTAEQYLQIQQMMQNQTGTITTQTGTNTLTGEIK